MDEADTPLAGLRGLLLRLVDDERDEISTLWIDAWHGGRRRPALNEEVGRQTEAWIVRLSALIEAGKQAGEFHTDNPRRSAARIMAVVDGLSVSATMRGTIDYETVEQLVFVIAESELGLARGALS